VAQQIKARKDVQQATALLSLLLEDRPGDIWIALEAAQAMPDKFMSQLAERIEQLPYDLKQTNGEHLKSIPTGERATSNSFKRCCDFYGNEGTCRVILTPGFLSHFCHCPNGKPRDPVLPVTRQGSPV
jgi:hypothetical protein